MPTLITTPGSATANAYVSLADADLYHLTLGNSAWAALAQADRESAIIRATLYLDGTYARSFSGTKATKEQALQWPRVNAKDSSGFAFDDDEIPAALERACCEAALLESATPGALTEVYTAGVRAKSEKAGPVGESYTYGAEYTGRDNFPSVENNIGVLLSTSGHRMKLERG